jgi:hypothetical protein
VLTHPEHGEILHRCLADHPSTYRDVLAEHFERHLLALRG